MQSAKMINISLSNPTCKSCLAVIFGLISEISIWDGISTQMHLSPVKFVIVDMCC